jgi:hypothetical protein
MTFPLPSLNLSFDKKSETVRRLENKNDLSNKNTINFNILNPLAESFISPPMTPQPMVRRNSVTSRSLTPRPTSKSYENSPERLKSKVPILKEEEDEVMMVESPESYNSPTFETVENEFKNQLLSFTTDLLLSNIDLIKNLTEFGNKVIFHVQQLKQLIAILYLSKEDREKYNELIDIETDAVIIHNCFCSNCNHPFIEKIKAININRAVNF